MKLKKIVQGLPITLMKGSKEIEITGITEHSQAVSPGNLFIARRGAKFDGNAYIPHAILAGASAILSDLYNPFLSGVTQLVAKDLSGCSTALAKRFYRDPAAEMFLIGVTGTSGKTSTTYLLKHLLETSQPTGLIGSLEIVMGERRLASELTTPDGLSLLKFLRDMLENGIDHAVMEVSSHALAQNRVEALSFDAAIFTNLTREHLDYHLSMANYAEAKGALFTKLKKGGVSIINADAEYANFFLEKARAEKSITYGIEEEADYRASDIRLSLEGTYFTLHSNGKKTPFFTPLLGRFNLLNTLAAIALLQERGFSLEMLQERLSSFPGVRGRMELVEKALPYSVFVDFAHKEDALKNVLLTLQELKEGRIFTLFGCGGERDREKRPRMAHVAEELSDYVIVTSDNPRGENPHTILQEIERGFQRKDYTILADRLEAIQYALSLLREKDILLIAGKGHETVQQIAGTVRPFDDVKVVRELLTSV